MSITFEVGTSRNRPAAPAKAGNAVKAGRNHVWFRAIAFVVCALIATTAFSQSQGPVQPPKAAANPQSQSRPKELRSTSIWPW